MRIFRTSAILLGWGAALVGVLQLQWLPASSPHGICGVWGCGPPVSALLAYHGFWLVLLSLPTAIICRISSPNDLRRIGRWGMVGACLGIVAICIWQRVAWWPQVSDWQREYFLTRCGFVIITLVDVPLLQTLLLSAACGIVGWSSQNQNSLGLEAHSRNRTLEPITSPLHREARVEHE